MKNNDILLGKIKTKTALKAKTLKLYPDTLIDPFILPINETSKTYSCCEHKFNMNIIVCPMGLPFGIYARLIISHFSHLEKFKYHKENIFEFRVARSTRELFKKITGGNITTDMQKVFEEQLAKVNNTYFSNKYTQESGCFTKLIGHLQKRGREYYYTPVGIYEDKSVKFTPIDIRVLQLCRLERQSFTPDLYIYLTKKLKYLKSEEIELNLHTMKEKIFSLHRDNSLGEFKIDLNNSLIFLKKIFEQLEFEVKNETITFKKCELLPAK